MPIGTGLLSATVRLYDRPRACAGVFIRKLRIACADSGASLVTAIVLVACAATQGEPMTPSKKRHGGYAIGYGKPPAQTRFRKHASARASLAIPAGGRWSPRFGAPKRSPLRRPIAPSRLRTGRAAFRCPRSRRSCAARSRRRASPMKQ
jgi:hypothetical protein